MPIIEIDNINKDSFHECEETGNHMIFLKGARKGRPIKKVRQELGHTLTTLFDKGFDNIIVNFLPTESTGEEIFYIYVINEKTAANVVDDLLVAISEGIIKLNGGPPPPRNDLH